MKNINFNYGWKNEAALDSSNYISPKVLKIIKSKKNTGKVLDIGCGNGNLCSMIEKLGFTVIGIDGDSDGIKIAQDNYKNCIFEKLIIGENSNEFSSRHGKFDIIISTEVIEHLYAPHHLLLLADELLANDGLLIITTPYHGYLKNLIISVFNLWDKHFTPLWHGGHIKFWSYRTISNLLNDNGFYITEFHGVGRFSFLWKSMVIVCKKNTLKVNIL
jgi:2-polyprenyl-3-methyl-5-hydroxy-6-metoxy-1,4-benzoquinol methylase